jgi:hypothetical protein
VTKPASFVPGDEKAETTARPRYEVRGETHGDGAFGGPININLQVRLIDASNGNCDPPVDVSPIRALLAQGCDLESDNLPVVAREMWDHRQLLAAPRRLRQSYTVKLPVAASRSLLTDRHDGLLHLMPEALACSARVQPDSIAAGWMRWPAGISL